MRFLFLYYFVQVASSFINLPPRSRFTRVTERRTLTSPRLQQSTSDLREEGGDLIREATVKAGCLPEQIGIEWKAGRVVVTISGAAYLYDDQAQDDGTDDDDGDDVLDEDPQSGANLVKVARAIHDALDMKQEDSVGYKIGMTYEIEVTTPGASNELSGIMFESYKGFDVMVDFIDPKTKKRNTVDGRLVERNDEFTVININGRMKNIRNDTVESVRLPKAKKE